MLDNGTGTYQRYKRGDEMADVIQAAASDHLLVVELSVDCKAFQPK
jgi:hypothetical protein